MTKTSTGIAIIGAGNIGIAVAYYLAAHHGLTDITLIDQGQPMAFTSAQSGENYRDWWPHRPMVRFMSRSIDLMEDIARASGNRIAMTRRGYVLATRTADISATLRQIEDASDGETDLRLHEGATAARYQPPTSPDWTTAPTGFDILSNPALIQQHFPYYDRTLRHLIHVRRAGDISGQQLGQFMLDALRAHGIKVQTGMVRALRQTSAGFALEIEGKDGKTQIEAERIVNAAGPFAGQIAEMLGVRLPLYNVAQQKIAFPDTEKAIPRDMPFSIDLDGQMIDWTEEERALLLQDPDLAKLAEPMPGAIHCRPNGGDAGQWIKLGWAFNETAEPESWTPTLRADYPEIVLRGAARLNPALKAYYSRLPRQMHHYGGYYTRTADNWPLIGPMGPDGAFMAAALSGHGTMGACASGDLAAAWITGAALPDYARPFSLARFAPGADMGPKSEESGLL